MELLFQPKLRLTGPSYRFFGFASSTFCYDSLNSHWRTLTSDFHCLSLIHLMNVKYQEVHDLGFCYYRVVCFENTSRKRFVFVKKAWVPIHNWTYKIIVHVLLYVMYYCNTYLMAFLKFGSHIHLSLDKLVNKKKIAILHSPFWGVFSSKSLVFGAPRIN